MAIKFKKISAVTVSLLKIEADKPIYVESASEMLQTEKHPKDKSDKNPPIVMQVVNLESGETQQIICAEVLKSELELHYPEKTYIGKQFEIIKHEKATGKQYSTYSITEIEVEKPAPAIAAEVSEKPAKK
jgi:hypothetical protein